MDRTRRSIAPADWSRQHLTRVFTGTSAVGAFLFTLVTATWLRKHGFVFHVGMWMLFAVIWIPLAIGGVRIFEHERSRRRG